MRDDIATLGRQGMSPQEALAWHEHAFELTMPNPQWVKPSSINKRCRASRVCSTYDMWAKTKL